MTLITVASWEDRFLLGARRLLSEERISHATIFYYEEFAKRTLSSRIAVKRLCVRKRVTLDLIPLKFENPVESWMKARNICIEKRKQIKHAFLDISTMPRDLIWSLLSFLRELKIKSTYVYNKPASYHSKWLSRDPGNPRLVYKLAGESQFGLKTTLLVITGFDLERTQQVINFFDPGETVLAIQTGPQFENLRMNVRRHREFFSGIPDITSFDIDAYTGDHGFAPILKVVERKIGKTNIVMASLGPKLSAIALFRVHMRHPEVGLTYTPSKDYNLKYSQGIGQTIRGPLF